MSADRSTENNTWPMPKFGFSVDWGTIKQNISFQIQMNTIKRQTVTIKLLDESGMPTVTWSLQNAWPTKISGTDLKSDGNQVAIDSIEIAHEGLTVTNSQV